MLFVTNDIIVLFKSFDHNLLFYITTRRKESAKNIFLNSCLIYRTKVFDTYIIIIVKTSWKKSLQPLAINSWSSSRIVKWSI